MPAKKHLLPFRAMPASWGLHGDAYAIAEANYNYDGEELERAIATIECRDDPRKLSRRMLEIDLRHHVISSYVYEHRIAEAEIDDPELLTLRKLEIDVANDKISAYDAARTKAGITHPAGPEREFALLEIDCQHGRIKKSEYDKRKATLKGEPWIAIINSGFDPDQGVDGVFFEFDWNAEWIEFLRKNGYSGHSDEQIVDEWFSDVCRSQNVGERYGFEEQG